MGMHRCAPLRNGSSLVERGGVGVLGGVSRMQIIKRMDRMYVCNLSDYQMIPVSCYPF